MENRDTQIFLKNGREKSLKNRHPWVFSGAIEKIKGDCQAGDIISVYSSDNEFLAKGFVNPQSQIFIRILTFEDEIIDRHFFSNRIDAAVKFRESFISKDTNAYRLVNAEGDFLPGLIIDKYGSALVLQFSSIGMSRIKSLILELLREIAGPKIIVERTEKQPLEGLQESAKVIFGKSSNLIMIKENGVKFWVDVLKGQKTGLFLDQRENRQLIAQLSKEKRLLNCFSYSGGFSVYAALRDAQTTSVESSESAQEIAKENFRLNNIDPSSHQFVTEDVFEYLRKVKEDYDIIILDPPAFVKTKKHLNKGTRGYKDINRLTMKIIINGGYILSCSCSNYVDWDLFQKILYAAAKEAERNIQIVSRFGAPPDHPVNIYHPEGEYLKSFLLRVI